MTAVPLPWKPVKHRKEEISPSLPWLTTLIIFSLLPAADQLPQAG